MFDIPFLGKIPLDAEVMDCCEKGKSIIKYFPDSPTSKSLMDIVEKIKNILN
jgi:ATP-binding protein involved in chromosome partitioning